MPVSVSSSLSHSHSIAVNTSLTTADTTTTNDQSLDASLVVVRTDDLPPSDSDQFLQIAAESTAVGDDTLAIVDILAQVDVTSPLGAVITADIDMTAAASSADGGLVFVSNVADISTGPANFLSLFTINTQQTVSNGSTTTAVSDTSVGLFAVVGGAGGGGTSASDTLTQHGGTGSGTGLADLDGNVGILQVTALALGEDTLVDVDGNVLTVEDQFSNVAALVTIAAG